MDTTPLVALKRSPNHRYHRGIDDRHGWRVRPHGDEMDERILVFVGALPVTADPIQDAVGFVILVVILFFNSGKNEELPEYTKPLV